MRTILLTAGFSLACWSLFAYLFHKDRSRYRNCYALFLAIFSLFPLVVNLFGSAGRIAVLFIVYPILLSILIVPFFLIYNGIVMMKREGRSLPQLLSLLLGLIILAGEAVFIAGIVRVITTDEVQPLLIPKAFLPVTLAVFCVSVIYGSVSFLIFMIYTLFLQIIPRKKDFDYVIIHGAGLLDGSRVSKLLRDRLDKAVEVYRQDPSPPWLIPSGGQGPDETIPEAEAMKGYLLTQGIPEKDILPESKSTTTGRAEIYRPGDQQLPRLPGPALRAGHRPQMHRHRQPRGLLLLAQRADPRIHRHPRRKKARHPLPRRLDRVHRCAAV